MTTTVMKTKFQKLKPKHKNYYSIISIVNFRKELLSKLSVKNVGTHEKVACEIEF